MCGSEPCHRFERRCLCLGKLAAGIVTGWFEVMSGGGVVRVPGDVGTGESIALAPSSVSLNDIELVQLVKE